jgi:hypothetical protein
MSQPEQRANDARRLLPVLGAPAYVFGSGDHDAAIQRAGCLQHVGHDRARDGDEHHFGARHGVGDRGRVCALPKFCRQLPRPGGVPCRERDVVAGGVPEPGCPPSVSGHNTNER